MGACGLPECGSAVVAVALLLDVLEVCGLRALVGEACLERCEDYIGVVGLRNLGEGAKDHALRHIDDVGYFFAVVEPACEIEHGFLAHAIEEHVGRSVDKYRRAQTVLPIVVVRQAAQGCLDASDDDGCVGVELAQYFRIYYRWVVGARAVASAGCVGIVGAASAVCRVVIDHRIHGARAYAEKEPRRAELAEIAQVVLPVGLWDNGHAVASGLQGAPYDSSPECGMVDISVAREEDHIDAVPSERFHFLYRCRKPVGGAEIIIVNFLHLIRIVL